MRYVTLFCLASAVGAAAAAVACGDSLGVQAVRLNAVDTVKLYALSGTPVSQPSAYSFVSRLALSGNGAVRTDQAAAFDFAFDIDTAGRPVLLPLGALKLGRLSGLQITAQDFDSVRVAPTNGYQLDSAVVVNDSSVVLIQSAPLSCINVPTPGVVYGKLHVLKIDTTPGGRSIEFEFLGDFNCGFRGLEAGSPKH